MKRITYVWLAGMDLAGVLASSSSGQSSNGQSSSGQSSSGQSSSAQNSSAQNVSAQNVPPPEPSLGSYARTARKDKKQQAAKRFDNDNLPKDDKLSVVGDASQSTTASQATPANVDPAQAAAAGDKPKVEPGQPAEERQKVLAKWQQKISDQQSQIDHISHELDLDQREYRLRAASFYGDAGERLRNEAQWDKEDADYKQKIAEKQKALDDAKQKMEETQEEARKSGVPNSVRDAAQQKPSETAEQ